MSGGGAFKIIWDLFRARIKIMSIKSRKEVRCQFLILCLYLYLSRLGCLIIDASSFPIKSSCCYSHTGTLHKHVHFNFALIAIYWQIQLPALSMLTCRKERSGGRRSFSVFLLLFAAEGIINSSLSFHLHGISFDDRLLNQHFFSSSIISWLTDYHNLPGGVHCCYAAFLNEFSSFFVFYFLFYCGIDSSMRLHWNCVTFLGVHK